MFKQGTSKLVLLLALATSTIMPCTGLGQGVEPPSTGELAYGKALFNYFQGKYFSAITDLTVASHYRYLNTEDKNAELLLGGMYLSYGMPDKASSVFTELLEQASDVTSPSVRDKALYHAGKYYYDEGRFDDARTYLTRIGDTLDDDFTAEKLYMLVNIHLRNAAFKEAIPLLHAFPANSIWQHYARFNIATSLIRNQQHEEGLQLLEKTVDRKTSGYEQRILNDKANIAIAYTYLKDNQPDQASRYFQRVRLEGSQTSTALLGLGWSWYQQNIHDQALLAWLELANQPFSSYAKQEALITIPYVFEKNDRIPDALHHYNIAIDNYTAEIAEIEQVMAGIKNGSFMRSLESFSSGFESSNPNTLLKQAAPDMHKHLASLFVSRDFHDALRNLQELRFLGHMLAKWENDLPALDLVLEEKRLTYNRKISRSDHGPLLERSKQLMAKRNSLAQQISEMEADDATLALIDEQEKAQLEKLAKINTRLSRIKNASDSQEQQDKSRLLNGLLSWQISTDYASRLWQARKALRELDATIGQMNKSIHSLSSTWQQAPARHQHFHAQIREKSARIRQLQTNIRQSIHQQETIVSSMALEAASQQANRLKMLHDRALFAKARIYDAMTSLHKAAIQ